MSASIALAPARTAARGRGTLAVVAALAANVVLSLAVDQLFHALDVYPPWGEPMYAPALFLLALSYRTVFGVVSGWIAARLAPDAPARHATALGVVGTVLCAASVLATVGRPELGPVWYPIALTLVAYPTARLGAAWQMRARRA